MDNHWFIVFSMQSSLNRYRLERLNLFREQSRDKGIQIARLVVDTTEKYNSYANDVYPKNQHMHLNPRIAILAIQFKTVDGFSVPHFRCVLRKCNVCPKYLYPKNKWQLKIIITTIYPSTSSRMFTGDPNTVFYLMKTIYLYTYKTC